MESILSERIQSSLKASTMNSGIGGKPHVAAVAQASYKFGSNLLSRVGQIEENIVFSNISVSSVLSLASLGAKENTLKQMKEVLQLPEEPETLKSAFYDITNAMKSDEKMTLETANGIFLSTKLEQSSEFTKDASKYFSSEIQSLDYSKVQDATATINSWVSKNTNGKIENFLEPDSLEADTNGVLLNTIYFKGSWITKFDPANTSEKDFHVTPDKIVKVHTMMSPKMQFAQSFNDELQCNIVALPYEGDRITMYLFLPKEAFSLPGLELKLASESFNPSVLDRVNNTVQGHVQLPKFKVESTHDLGPACIALGLSDLFDGKQCNISGIAGNPGELCVSKAVQKAVVEVSEEGSEASGSSGLMIMVRSVFMSDPIVVDHPFVFMIKDKSTGLVLFRGRVVDPSK